MFYIELLDVDKSSRQKIPRQHELGTQEGDLDLKKDSIIVVTKQEAGGWWEVASQQVYGVCEGSSEA